MERYKLYFYNNKIIYLNLKLCYILVFKTSENYNIYTINQIKNQLIINLN